MFKVRAALGSEKKAEELVWFGPQDSVEHLGAKLFCWQIYTLIPRRSLEKQLMVVSEIALRRRKHKCTTPQSDSSALCWQ